MCYTLRVSNRAKTRLRSITRNDRGIANSFLKKMDEILLNPHHYDRLKGDLAGAFKAKVRRDYRIAFEIYDDLRKVVILDCGNRKDFYTQSNKNKIIETSILERQRHYPDS